MVLNHIFTIPFTPLIIGSVSFDTGDEKLMACKCCQCEVCFGESPCVVTKTVCQISCFLITGDVTGTTKTTHKNHMVLGSTS